MTRVIFSFDAYFITDRLSPRRPPPNPLPERTMVVAVLVGRQQLKLESHQCRGVIKSDWVAILLKRYKTKNAVGRGRSCFAICMGIALKERERTHKRQPPPYRYYDKFMMALKFLTTAKVEERLLCLTRNGWVRDLPGKIWFPMVR